MGDDEWEELAENDPELSEDDDTPQNLYGFAERSYRTIRRSDYDEPVFSDKQMWVLRNLSKREYVRADAAGPGSKDPGDPYVPVERFGEVVLSRICWSSDASASMPEKVDITRGAWAGDRFDINTAESLEVVDGGAEWTDATEEVAVEMYRLWQGE